MDQISSTKSPEMSVWNLRCFDTCTSSSSAQITILAVWSEALETLKRIYIFSTIESQC